VVYITTKDEGRTEHRETERSGARRRQFAIASPAYATTSGKPTAVRGSFGGQRSAASSTKHEELSQRLTGSLFIAFSICLWPFVFSCSLSSAGPIRRSRIRCEGGTTEQHWICCKTIDFLQQRPGPCGNSTSKFIQKNRTTMWKLGLLKAGIVAPQGFEL
jgi:hypothetical protein